MGRGADWIEERGALRAEKYGSVVELMESKGGYRLPLFGKRDRDSLRALLDAMDARDVASPALALDERRRA